MIRLLTPEESASYQRPGYQTEVVRYEGKGEVHLAYSCGQVFVHSLTVDSDDAFDFAALYLFVRSHLKSKGFKTYNIHVEPGTPAQMREFWYRLGEEVCTVLSVKL